MKILLFLLLIFLSIGMGVERGEYDPFRITFYTKRIKGKTFDEVLKEIKEKLEEVNLPYIDSWTVDLKSGEEYEDINILRYSTIIACDIKDRDDLIGRSPVVANLIPCTINVYETVDGNIYVSVINEKLYLLRYKKQIFLKDLKRIKAVYMRIRCVIREVAL